MFPTAVMSGVRHFIGQMDAFIKGHHQKVEVGIIRYLHSAFWQDSSRSSKNIKILSEILNELLLQQSM